MNESYTDGQTGSNKASFLIKDSRILCLSDIKMCSICQGGEPHDAQRKSSCEELLSWRSGQVGCECLCWNVTFSITILSWDSVAKHFVIMAFKQNCSALCCLSSWRNFHSALYPNSCFCLQKGGILAEADFYSSSQPQCSGKKPLSEPSFKLRD